MDLIYDLAMDRPIPDPGTLLDRSTLRYPRSKIRSLSFREIPAPLSSTIIVTPGRRYGFGSVLLLLLLSFRNSLGYIRTRTCGVGLTNPFDMALALVVVAVLSPILPSFAIAAT